MIDMAALIAQAKLAPVTAATKKLAVNCLDFTSLNDADTDDDIRNLCARAVTPLGNVAAICIYPQFVSFAKRLFAEQEIESSIKIATVVNFPSGNDNVDEVIAATKIAIFDGADEIDVVFPYQAYLAGKKDSAIALIKSVKHACGDKTLKVILETGVIADTDTIAAASADCLNAGADFLKTSTGKVAVGATFEAAATMLQAIKKYQMQNKRVIGFKVSGGVRTTADAAQYIALANLSMGAGWVTPATFRIGASGLLTNLLDSQAAPLKSGY